MNTYYSFAASLGAPYPPSSYQVDDEFLKEILNRKFVGKRVVMASSHPHVGKSGTVDRFEFVTTLKQWGFVVRFDDGQSGFVFSPKEWSIL